MAKIEPGAFKAADDARVFDDVEEGDDEEGSRLPLLIVIALLVLAAFGGVVWLAYNQGVQRGRNEAPRPLVADAGNTVPGHSYKVYEQAAPADPDTAESDGVPAPPSDAGKTPPAASAAAQTPAAPLSRTPVAQAQTAPKVTPQPRPAATSPVATAAPRPLTPDVPAAKPKPAVETPPPTAQAQNEPTAASGAYVLQIGAYKSEDEANTAWKSYKAKHASLSGYSPDVKQVDLGEKGVWYRLRVSSFATRDAAQEVCSKLKADGGDCLLAKK